jgi:hypothetical protein
VLYITDITREGIIFSEVITVSAILHNLIKPSEEKIQYLAHM